MYMYVYKHSQIINFKATDSMLLGFFLKTNRKKKTKLIYKLPIWTVAMKRNMIHYFIPFDSSFLQIRWIFGQVNPTSVQNYCNFALVWWLVFIVGIWVLYSLQSSVFETAIKYNKWVNLEITSFVARTRERHA